MLEDFYDIETEPMIDLGAFYGKPKMITDKCLVIFSKEIHDYLLANYSCKSQSWQAFHSIGCCCWNLETTYEESPEIEKSDHINSSTASDPSRSDSRACAPFLVADLLQNL